MKRGVGLASTLFVVAAGSGCTTSALIPDRDVTYEHATERLERTATTVATSGASAREQLVFLQAESLYRYRFSPEKRGTASVVAEAAAAATDLPILQSLSGTLDVMDLRLRSADAAVQIWETFARRYPQSSLRPLALYRLGFAYRNTIASGFPRDSGDEAFDELSRVGGPPPLLDAAAQARCVPWKSKQAAATWSLVPGLGQFYVHEYGSGVARLAVALASAAAIIVPLVIAADRASELTWKHDWPLLVTGTAGLIVLSFDYTSSYEDALRGAVQWNEREETKFESEHPEVP